jgi:hypothetical protein
MAGRAGGQVDRVDRRVDNGLIEGLLRLDETCSAWAATRIMPQADAAPTVRLLAWQTAEEVTVMIVIIAAIEAWVRRRRTKRQSRPG